MIVLSVFLLVAGHIQWISCKCSFENFNFDYPPVFTQKIEDTEIVIKPIGQQLHISEGASLNAYCDTNFSSPIFGGRPEEGISSVSVKCTKGVLYYEDINSDEERFQEAREPLACYGSQPGFYVDYRNNNCLKYGATSFTYGLTVDGIQIVLATFCFNIATKEIVYIHYKLSEQSFKLQNERREYAYISPERKVAMNFIESNENRTFELNSYIRRNTDISHEIGLFKFESLVPNERLVKSFPYQADILEGPNSIPWWTNLKEGNWRLLEQLMEKERVLNDYDVYTGVAHVYDIENMKFTVEEQQRQEARQRESERERLRILHMQKEKELAEAREREREELERERAKNLTYVDYKPSPAISVFVPRYNTEMYYGRNNGTYNGYRPSNNNKQKRAALFGNFYEQEIRYLSASVLKSVPLYIWTYLKSPSGDANSTVVVAINSPFIEVSKYYELTFCRDNCPAWLEGLAASAKISTLGYMFCCNPAAARNYIPALP